MNANQKLLIFAGLGLAAAFPIAALIRSDEPPPLSPAEQTTADARQRLRVKDATIVTLGEALVRASLKDPLSVNFEGVYGRTRHGLNVACGQVNARNSFGGYAGATFFVAHVDTGEVIIQSPETQGRFSRAWAQGCMGREDGAPSPPIGLYAIRWGERPPSNLKPYNAARQVWVYNAAHPAAYLGVPVKQVEYEVDHGRIFGADVIVSGQAAYDQLKSALTDAYGDPTTELTATGYCAWDWGKGSGLVQLSWSDAFKEADVHLEQQARR